MGTRTHHVSVILVLLYSTAFSTELRSGIYSKKCKGMTFDQSSLTSWLRGIQVASLNDCVNQCLHHSKCLSITFNNLNTNDNNCMLYGEETVACLPGHSDTEIIMKVGQLYVVHSDTEIIMKVGQLSVGFLMAKKRVKSDLIAYSVLSKSLICKILCFQISFFSKLPFWQPFFLSIRNTNMTETFALYICQKKTM